jgi:hypothetical protein
MVYLWLFPLMWLAFIVFWIVKARNGKAVAERESAFSRLSHYLPLALAPPVCRVGLPGRPFQSDCAGGLRVSFRTCGD